MSLRFVAGWALVTTPNSRCIERPSKHRSIPLTHRAAYGSRRSAQQEHVLRDERAVGVLKRWATAEGSLRRLSPCSNSARCNRQTNPTFSGSRLTTDAGFYAVRTFCTRREDGRWKRQTPATAASLADQEWSLREWLTFPTVHESPVTT